jgi:hypothetical protein
LHRRDTLFCIFEFGSNPERSTANELIVLDVHNAARNVSIHNVEGEVKSFRTQAECEMDFNQEVN